MNPPISVCIIGLNEEKKVEDCLRSVLPVADEIIFVDSGSTDQTLSIVKKYTDKIYHQQFLGHVQQKNLAVSKASHDWILSLDCDERLSAGLADAILARQGRLEQYAAYSMPRKTFYVYRWLNHCWYPDRKVRLFNKQQARWGGINPHDYVEVHDGQICQLSEDILHYSFDSISGHLRTLDNFTEIGAREILARGQKVSIFAPLGHGLATFIRLYFFKLGFLDGLAGFVVSTLSFMHAFVKYAKVLFYRREQADKQVK